MDVPNELILTWKVPFQHFYASLLSGLRELERPTSLWTTGLMNMPYFVSSAAVALLCLQPHWCLISVVKDNVVSTTTVEEGRVSVALQLTEVAGVDVLPIAQLWLANHFRLLQRHDMTSCWKNHRLKSLPMIYKVSKLGSVGIITLIHQILLLTTTNSSLHHYNKIHKSHKSRTPWVAVAVFASKV